MKGGKAGRPRKPSGTRAGAKSAGRGGAKKRGAAKRDSFAQGRQKEKRTTKLGAVRLPDDE
jgi:hypothetical protein